MTTNPNQFRLRVALISYNYGEYCVQLANGLAREAEVLLVVPKQTIGPHRARLDRAVHVVSFSSPRLREPLRQLCTIRQLLQLVRAFLPDVVHYQGAHPWFDLAFPLLRRFPLVFTIHDFRPHPGDRLSRKTPLWLEKLARRSADELIVHSRFTRKQATEAFPDTANRISVIPHVQIGGSSHRKTLAEDENLILFFGRIWKYKGLEYLIRAEPLITKRVPNARILIAGQGEGFSRYRRLMAHPARFIVDNQYISEEQAAAYFERASVVVLPYIEASQSGVIPLAYSAGKPVIATAVGGLPEMVENGRTGFLVAPGDVQQLADAVTRLLLDAPLRRQMGAAARYKVETECAPHAIAQRTMSVYRRAMDRAVLRRRRLFFRRSWSVAFTPGEDSG